jgi:hypothetical protein
MGREEWPLMVAALYIVGRLETCPLHAFHAI